MTSKRSAFASQVEKQLRSGGVWQERDDATPVDGLIRAVESGRVSRADLVPVIDELLESDSPAVRTGAVAMLDVLDCVIPAARLHALSSRYTGIAPADNCGVTESDLATALTLKAASCVSSGTDATVRSGVVTQLQTLARAGNVRATIELGRLDSAWLLSHTFEVPAREALVALLPVLPPGTRGALIASLAPFSSEEKRRLARPHVWNAIPAAEAAVLRGIIGLVPS